MEKTKEIKLTEKDNLIVATLTGSEPKTFAQINEACGGGLSSGHLVSAITKGLVESCGETKVNRPTKRKVATYVIITADPTTGDKGVNKYSDNEKAILTVLKDADAPMTVAAVSEAAGIKFFPGSFTALVKKGNIEKGDEVETVATTQATVKLYRLVGSEKTAD